MPVLSPHRSSSSALTGSYRSSLGSSALDRPFYGSSSSYSPRYSYSERYSSRMYIDADGRRIVSRSGSITEDGVTTRYREDSRENSILRRDSLSRDSGISSIRENSILDTPKRERDSSINRTDSGRESRYTSKNVVDSIADLRNRYSPANYVPAVHRNKENISRSKSINDIGLPPIERTETKSVKKKVNDGLNYNNSLSLSEFANNTNNSDKGNDNMYLTEDDNGNRQPVSEIRKKFEPGLAKLKSPLMIDGSGIKLSENRFKKHDCLENTQTKIDRNDVRNENTNGSKIYENGDVFVEKRPAKLSNLENDRLKVESNIVTKLENERPPKIENDRLLRLENDRPPRIENNRPKLENGRLSTLENDSSVKKQKDEQNYGDSKYDICDIKNVGYLNNSENQSKFTVPERKDSADDGIELGGSKNSAENDVSSSDSSETKVNGDISRNMSRVNNFSSYIPSRDYEKGDVNGAAENFVENGEITNENRNDVTNVNKFGKSRFYQDNTNNDLSTSPRLNRALSQNSAGTSGSPSTSNSLNANSINRNSLERDRRDHDDERSYGRIGASPVRHQGLNGLKNIGNTCFMNSVIQCLSNTKPLLEYVRKDMYISDINTSISSMKGALIKAFSQVIKELWSEDSSDRVVNTVSLKSQIQRFAPRFIGYSQQDAQEFLRYLLEGLHEDVNRITTKPTPIHTEIDEKLSDNDKSAESWHRYLRMDNSKIVDIFVGQLKSTLRCTYCGHCSMTFDPFWDLSLPIPQKVGPVRLQQCLESFTREETLDGDEKPTCSKCKERRKCTKSFSIQKFPKILVIHLKRFSPTERFRGKLSVNVDFPLEGLDMSNYAADSHVQCRYNLYAISNHSGTTYSGHYTAYCRHPYSLTWHEYNDSRVSSISPKSIVSGEAYVLFYELDSQKAHL